MYWYENIEIDTTIILLLQRVFLVLLLLAHTYCNKIWDYLQWKLVRGNILHISQPCMKMVATSSSSITTNFLLLQCRSCNTPMQQYFTRGNNFHSANRYQKDFRPQTSAAPELPTTNPVLHPSFPLSGRGRKEREALHLVDLVFLPSFLFLSSLVCSLMSKAWSCWSLL